MRTNRLPPQVRADFDAGFVYGLAFARALDDAKIARDRVRRGQILRLVKGADHTTRGADEA